MAAGHSHTVGLKSDGTVVAVGGNGAGQCNVSIWNLGARNGRAEINGTWSSGIWYGILLKEKWIRMSSYTPSGDLTVDDLTADRRADVASWFSSGLWYQNGATLGWTKVTSVAPDLGKV